MSRPIRTEDARRPRQVWLVLTGAGLAAWMAASAILLSYKIQPPPGNARVVVDEERRTYASTPCVLFNRLDRELIANRKEIGDASNPVQLLAFANERTIGEIGADGTWRRDTACNYATGFDQIVTTWMRVAGYRSRWSDDGQWRW